MTSRKLLMYLDGLLATTEGWYTKAIRRDYQKWIDDKAEAAEKLARAESKAQLNGQPLDMADLQ